MNVAAATGPPVVTAVTNQDIGKASANNALGAQFVNAATGDWCFTVTNSKGDKAKVGYKYSNAGGLAEGACTSAAG
jgi:hypothetical protein